MANATKYDPTSVAGRSALRAVREAAGLRIARLSVVEDDGDGDVCIADDPIIVATLYGSTRTAIPLATAIVAAVHALPDAMDEIERLRGALDEIARLYCENYQRWPEAPCSNGPFGTLGPCASCLARRALGGSNA